MTRSAIKEGEKSQSAGNHGNIFHRPHRTAEIVQRFQKDDVHADTHPSSLIVQSVPENTSGRGGWFILHQSPHESSGHIKDPNADHGTDGGKGEIDGKEILVSVIVGGKRIR